VPLSLEVGILLKSKKANATQESRRQSEKNGEHLLEF